MNIKPDIPTIKNINYWHKEKTIFKLGKIREFVNQIKDDSKNFFALCLDKTAITCSLTRKNEFKRFRIKIEKIKKFNPNVLDIFINICRKNIKILENNPINEKPIYKLFINNTRKKLPINEKVDLVLTSPPYGDSKTTVAYGEFSSFGLAWIKNLNPFGNEELPLDKISLGGKRDNLYFKFELLSINLKNVIKK
jgi:site-specific DNA-methyltransferase (cytosine-N4-specific)